MKESPSVSFCNSMCPRNESARSHRVRLFVRLFRRSVRPSLSNEQRTDRITTRLTDDRWMRGGGRSRWSVDNERRSVGGNRPTLIDQRILLLSVVARVADAGGAHAACTDGRHARPASIGSADRTDPSNSVGRSIARARISRSGSSVVLRMHAWPQLCTSIRRYTHEFHGFHFHSY